MKKLLFLALVFAASCTTSKFQNGTYRVASVKHASGTSIVKLEGVNREFVLPTDTLKKGDLIYFSDKPVLNQPTAKNK